MNGKKNKIEQKFVKIDQKKKKLSKNCQKVVKKLSKSCQKVVKKLSKSCQKVVKKLSKSCQKVVKQNVLKLSKSWPGKNNGAINKKKYNGAIVEKVQ
jgi:uncharacterized membrane-anchored protein YhcB (DUF1043 family)